MKKNIVFSAAVIAVLACSPSFLSLGQVSNDVKQTRLQMGPTGTSSQNGSLSEKDISELKTDWTDEKTGIKYNFQASFGVANVEEKDRRRLEKLGKVPYRITCTLYEMKQSKGTTLSKRMTGTAKFYVRDESNKDIIKKSVSLEKMCPS